MIIVRTRALDLKKREAMGLMKFLASDDKKKYNQIETPDPVSFKVLESYNLKADGAIALKIKYEGCSNYNGIKILVYDSADKYYSLAKKGSVDPHFLEKEYSPIARFEPTEQGWKLACKLVEDL